MIAPNNECPERLEARRIRNLQQSLLERLNRETGTEHNPVTMSHEAPEDWTKEAKAVLKEYKEACRAESALNSKRCSREVSRFMGELKSRKPLTEEVAAWWLNRY